MAVARGVGLACASGWVGLWSDWLVPDPPPPKASDWLVGWSDWLVLNPPTKLRKL